MLVWYFGMERYACFNQFAYLEKRHDSAKTALDRCSCSTVQSVRGAVTKPKVCIIQTEPGRQGKRGERKDICIGWNGLSGWPLTCSPNCVMTAITGPKAILGTLDMLCIWLSKTCWGKDCTAQTTCSHVSINPFYFLMFSMHGCMHSGLKRRMPLLLWWSKCSLVQQIMGQRVTGGTSQIRWCCHT